MIRALLFILVIANSPGFCQEVDLEYFFLSSDEIPSEGSIIFYSDSLSNIDSNDFLAIEGWNYDIDNKEYKYFCFVKIGETIHKLESESRSEVESRKESVFKNGDVTLIIKTNYLKELGYESYYVKGKLTVISGKTRKLYEIFGRVDV